MISRMYSLLACVLLSLVFSSHVAAQTVPGAYPTKPIRIIVPFTPGGPAPADVAIGLTGQRAVVAKRSRRGRR